MSFHRSRKKPYDQGKQSKKARKNPHELLESVNKLKGQIIQDIYNGQASRAEKRLEYLRENQREQPELLAKSLSDVAHQISDSDFKLRLYEEALRNSRADAVTLTSYATALANANQPERAFALFDKSLAINPHDPITLTSHAALLEHAGDHRRALENFQKIGLDKFEKAIDGYAGHRPIDRLTIAKNILAVNFYSEKALKILRRAHPAIDRHFVYFL